MFLDALGSRKKYKRDINRREPKNSIRHQMQTNLLGRKLMICPHDNSVQYCDVSR